MKPMDVGSWYKGCSLQKTVHDSSGLFIILFALLPYAAGDVIDAMSYRDVLSEDGTVSEELMLSIINNTQESISLLLPETAYNIHLNNASISSRNLTVPLECQSCSIALSYLLRDAIRREGNAHIYSRTLSAPMPVMSLAYEVTLPPGHVISPMLGPDPLVPAGSKVTTDGEHITITWTKTRPELPERFYMRFMSEETRRSLWTSLQKDFQKAHIWVMLGISLAIGLVAGIAIILRYRKCQATIPSTVLNRDERAVLSAIKQYEKELKILKQAEKPMNQKEIAKRLNWSKSKVSAVCTNLAQKRIIERAKIGRSYEVQIIGKVVE